MKKKIFILTGIASFCLIYNTNLTFKVVLIDATTYAKYQNEDLSDYETVKKLFNITEEENIR